MYQPKKAWHFPQGGIAVKAVSLRSAEAASGLALEAELLRRVVQAAGPHPNVVTLHSTFLVGEHARLALDLASGDLYHHMLRRRGFLARGDATALARQLAAGVAHLHTAEVAHRDIKMDNALLFSSAGGALTLKIADLGLGVHSSQLRPVASLDLPAAQLAALRRATTHGVSREPYGTPSTMAPEVVTGRWYCPYTADAWSLGICLLTIFAPHEHDEYDYDRTPFYPFGEAATRDADYAAFIDPPPPPTTPTPPRRGLPPGCGLLPPGCGLLPPGCGLPTSARGMQPSLTAPPGLAPRRQLGQVARLLARRASWYGMAPPEPPLHASLMATLDGLLTTSVDERMPVAEAATTLQNI